jgi:hypothetical protein
LCSGNNQHKINEIIDKHQELHHQITNKKIKQNLIIFNIPIINIPYRGSKSYIEQITEASKEELNNTTYNKLYLSELGIIISDSDIKFNKYGDCDRLSSLKNRINILQTYYKSNYIEMYKHFDWDNEPIPEILSTHLENILDLKKQIKELENKISEEKSKIIKLDYVQSKLNKPIKKTDEYIQTIKNLFESFSH